MKLDEVMRNAFDNNTSNVEVDDQARELAEKLWMFARRNVAGGVASERFESAFKQRAKLYIHDQADIDRLYRLACQLHS